jgi:antitoxin ParD1/3/4
MATVRKTITLTDAQNDWIKTQIDSGAYTNDSEVVRDLIRKAQYETDEIEAIRAALIEGEKSGQSTRSPEDIRAAVKNRKSLSG